jgi:hypothetical protein
MTGRRVRQNGGGDIPTTTTPAVGTDDGAASDDDGDMDTDTALAQPTDVPPSTPSAGRRYHAAHVVAIVVGCLMLLPGVAMLVGGGAAASAQAFATDDGYFRFTPDRVGSDGVAVAATDLWLDGRTDDDAPNWLLDTLDVNLRLRVSAAPSTDEVFVGIARTPDVERYLAGARYSDVVEMDGHTPRYDQVVGIRSIGAPATQDFWAVSASGDGEQELTWDARGGNWSAVVMNADGSPAVAADVEIGVHSGAVMPIAIVLMAIGTLLLAGAIVLIVVGIRGRRQPDADRPLMSTSPFPSPMPRSPEVRDPALHDPAAGDGADDGAERAEGVQLDDELSTPIG